MYSKALAQAVRARRKSMTDQVSGIIIAKAPDMDKHNMHVLRCARFAADAEALFAVSGRAQDKDQADHWRALARRAEA